MVTRRRRRARPRAPWRTWRIRRMTEAVRSSRRRTCSPSRHSTSWRRRRCRSSRKPSRTSRWTRASSARSAASRWGARRRGLRILAQLREPSAFMRHLESVQVTGERRSHWVAKAPAGKTVEWDAETTEDRINELIAWRSLPGSKVYNAGEVRFERAPGDRGTELRVNSSMTRRSESSAPRSRCSGARSQGSKCGRSPPLEAGDGDRRDRALRRDEADAVHIPRQPDLTRHAVEL